MKLTVPYHSQYIEIEDPFWNIRGCGAAAMKMVAEFYEKEMPDLVSLCEEAKKKNGYDMANGWVHDYIVERLKETGLYVFRKEGLPDLSDVIDFLTEGKPVIVSVTKKVLEQTRFHLIVLVGYEKEGDEISIFYYHEPEATSVERGAYRKCTKQEFESYFLNRGIFASAIS